MDRCTRQHRQSPFRWLNPRGSARCLRLVFGSWYTPRTQLYTPLGLESKLSCGCLDCRFLLLLVCCSLCLRKQLQKLSEERSVLSLLALQAEPPRCSRNLSFSKRRGLRQHYVRKSPVREPWVIRNNSHLYRMGRISL